MINHPMAQQRPVLHQSEHVIPPGALPVGSERSRAGYQGVPGEQPATQLRTKALNGMEIARIE